MNQPQVLIEGGLAFPKLRPFDGLPPPFGSISRIARLAVQRTPQTAVQRAIQGAIQREPRPARPGQFPPGVKHVLFYKAPQQRVDTHRWDAALEEAKRYLQMGTSRPRSSRSDHLLAGAIFAGCTIALTWLLVTCSMKDAEKVKAVSVTLAAAARQAEIAAGKPTAGAGAAVESAVSPVVSAHADAVPEIQVAQAVPLSIAPPKHVAQASPPDSSERKPGTHVAVRDQNTPSRGKAVKRVKVARLSEAHVNERMVMNRAAHPAAKPKVSNQPEWVAGAAHHADVADDASWLNWAAQQHRPAPTMRAAPPMDTNWNAHMTQRRVTDNPDAFQHDDRSKQ
ncbi:hypothetical protein [Paraburkholderia fungorum]|uniref:hypothetical protein n=1 Tax=Paraburkholderia fungorum TaxID=134537 RepID=UPI0004AAC568|nr:hypothetical protein [Paraburkholderia fungorum]KFX62664.1 hypothetical protein KBK24_0126200 [Burkholderia sp. K24]USX05142.1 hypothetical protein NHH62_03165 [Paraburkholderia fungorum]